jgi:hypothetical protein
MVLPGRRAGANVPPNGRKCLAQRAEMSGPAGAKVPPSGQKLVTEQTLPYVGAEAMTDPELRHTGFQMSSFV